MRNIKHCPLCNGTSSSPYYSYGAPNKIQVYNRICNTCGLVFQSPRYDYDELKNYYKNYTKISQPQIADIPIPFEELVLGIARLRLEFLKKFIKDGDRVLDIGCSFGAMLKVLRDESGFNLKLVGVNPEESFARFGQEKYGLDIRIGMFEEQNFAPGSFDLVILDNVIEHFDNPRLAVRLIHKLLSEKGRIFIATNNLDQPHGFLWQNFFPDHTVTFSPKTLKALLECEGFNVLEQDYSGHITCEGYHYPYQYCVAIKTTVPDNYDFKLNGDSKDEKVKQAKLYERKYLKENRLAKKLYELSLIQKKNIAHRFYINFLKYWGRITGQPIEFQLANHTLPPEKYFFRRVLVAVCQTDSDVELALKMYEKSRLNPLLYVLMITQENQLVVRICPPDFLKNSNINRFENLRSFWTYLYKKLPRIDTGISLQLYNADLEDTALIRTYLEFYNKGKKYGLVNFRQFTNALWEFFTYEVFSELQTQNNNIDITLFSFFDKEGSLDKEYLIWPQKEDYEYYYKNRFDKYYKFPKSISLDLSPNCNKRCDKCQFHSPRSPYVSLIKKDKIMPKELALSIIKEVSTWDEKPAISTSFSGEPLIYPYLLDVLEYAKKLDLPVHITTNGVCLSENLSQMLLKIGVDNLIVSIDSLNEEIYNQLQAPGNLSQVIENLLRFLQLRGPNKKPVVGVHFTMNKINLSHFNEYLEFFITKVDFVSRAIQQDQFTSCSCILPLWFPLGKKMACWALWNNMYIRWNGDISFCGFDITGKSSKLNVYKRTLLDIWNSEEFWYWRNAHLNNDRNILYCKACPDWAGLRTVIFKKDNYKVCRSPLSEVYTIE